MQWTQGRVDQALARSDGGWGAPPDRGTVGVADTPLVRREEKSPHMNPATEISNLDRRIAQVALRAGKECTRCQRWLHADAFPRNSRLLSGLGSWCKRCQVEYTRQWRAEHRDELNARRRQGPFQMACSDCGRVFMAKVRSQHRCPGCQAEWRKARPR
jgi:hypothetical protein